MNEFIHYKCRVCGKSFFLLSKEVQHSEEENRYITCPYFGRHRNIHVVNKYANLKECMEKQKAVYSR